MESNKTGDTGGRFCNDEITGKFTKFPWILWRIEDFRQVMFYRNVDDGRFGIGDGPFYS